VIRRIRRNQHYHHRINRVLDYIAQHLDGELSLTRLSSIACFSPFHFHRIFQGIIGETLNSHVRSVRLEKSRVDLDSNTSDPPNPRSNCPI
jgi:transcriptional regulator GlxA family with amidase domain